MSRYTVVWLQSVQDELAELWLSAGDRNAITAAADLIEHKLRDEPSAQGVELKEDLRALFAPPLRILFSVREDDRLVEVLRVKRL